MPFRLCGKTFFLTWPRNETTKEECLANCLTLWDDASLVVVAEEEHQSGEPHLHAIISFAKRKDMKDCNAALDALTGKHGNYQSARSLIKTLRYVCKEGNFVSHGPMPDISEKVKCQDKIAKAILTGKLFKELVEDDPGYCMVNKRKLEEFIGWSKRQRLSEDLRPWVVPTITSVNVDAALTVQEWLHSNILLPRLPRQKQLWICGRPGIGKSRLLGVLRTMLRCYDMPRDEEYYDGYEDGLYDLVILDEYKHQKRLQFLNAWCDGQPLPLRQKGSQSLKSNNLPLIVCSNFCIEECYREGIGRDALRDRFECVDFGGCTIVVNGGLE